MSTTELPTNSDVVEHEEEEESLSDRLHGLLVSYGDDQLDECVRSALKRKSRVRYKCMDTFSNFLAFGTTSGAIYLYKLKAISHSSCSLASMIPCDQGSIEVIKFLPNPQTDDLLVAIGTSRGSLVIFRLTQLPGDENPSCNEIYRAESFTNNWSIRLIECDQDLIDLSCPFTRLYLCDSANKLYVLDSSSIYAAQKQSLRLFYSNNLPILIFSANDSKINQISVHRSQLLISTDETTRLFNEQTNQLSIIGKKKRREGFYGACFFNPSYKPPRIMQMGGHLSQQSTSGQNTAYSSTNSLSEMDNLYLFVARPMFRLWQVNNKREVMLTHQFEPLIKAGVQYNQVVQLSNEPLDENAEVAENPGEIIDKFKLKDQTQRTPIKSDHFEKLVQIHSSTLGNLLLSYTQNELFVIDPVGAKLIVWYSQPETIVQVCCNENELYIWSLKTAGRSSPQAASGNENPNTRQQFQVKRLVLLATTQFVLELHRLHRYLTMVMFVELFADLFRRRMALPLSGTSIITTEGGLLRNVLLNAWDMYETKYRKRKQKEKEDRAVNCVELERMVEEIVEESRQLKRSYADLTDSRFFLTMTNENIDRLCTEPYASLISLEVSIKDLHTTHVIHFNKDAVERRRSVANLSKSIQNLSGKLGDGGQFAAASRHKLARARAAKSSLDVRSSNQSKSIANLSVEGAERPEDTCTIEEKLELEPEAEAPSTQQVINDAIIEQVDEQEEEDEERKREAEAERKRALVSRCAECRWPRPRSHLQLPSSSAQKDQLKWIEENLLSGFEENIQIIEELAFEHALWQTYLRCLAYRNAIEDYITCCMMLDDIRLLDIEQFVIVRGGQEEILSRLLDLLSEKIDFASTQSKWLTCLRCGAKLEQEEHSVVDLGDDAFTFNLVNLFEQFIMRRNADVKKIISCLLKHPKLLNKSVIPTTFYLKAIATATLVANQSPLNRARLQQLRAPSFRAHNS